MFHNDLLTPGLVFPDDPPPIGSGMSQVELDHQGRLTYFETIPAQKLDAPVPVAPVDWTPVFTLAGLDPRTAEDCRAALDLARHVGHADGLDRHVAGERAALTGGSRRPRRTSSGIHGVGTLAEDRGG